MFCIASCRILATSKMYTNVNCFQTHLPYYNNIFFLNNCCRCSSSSNNSRVSRVKQPMVSMYSEEQQQKIIDILKKCALNNNIRLFLNEKRLNGLRIFLEQNQNINNVNLLLDIDGFGPKILSKICEDILLKESLDEEKSQIYNVQVDDIGEKRTLQTNFISPSRINQDKVESFVCIHLGINMISWVKLHTTPTFELNSWDTIDLSSYADHKWDVLTVLKLLNPREVAWISKGEKLHTEVTPDPGKISF